jgi:hypothetical protein
MHETMIFRWQDRAERSFVVLHLSGGHFRVAWAGCDPPQSDNFLEESAHTTSVPDEAIALMLQHVRKLAEEPDEVERVEPRLRAALRESIV